MSKEKTTKSLKDSLTIGEKKLLSKYLFIFFLIISLMALFVSQTITGKVNAIVHKTELLGLDEALLDRPNTQHQIQNIVSEGKSIIKIVYAAVIFAGVSLFTSISLILWNWLVGRKKVLDTIELQSKYLENLIRIAPNAMIVLNEKNLISKWNKEAENIFGFKEKEVIGKDIDSLITNKSVHEEAQTITENISSGGQLTGIERVRYRKNGDPVNVLIYAIPVHLEEKLIGAMAIYVDITERKENEEKLLLSSKIIDVVANAITITDPNGKIEWVNPAFSDITGYSFNDAIGQNPRILKSGKHTPEFYKDIWETIKDKKVWRGEITNKRKDGSFYHEIETITPILNNDGDIHKFVAIKNDISDLVEAREKIVFQSTHDTLTNCLNRREFVILANKEISRAQRYNHPLSAIIIDIDHFKNINDSYGHSTGDEILISFVNHINEFIRNEDIFCRYGGEEFAILLPETELKNAVIFAERVRNSIENFKFNVNENTLRITASFGASELFPKTDDYSSLIDRADKALYKSKHNGRNKVSI